MTNKEKVDILLKYFGDENGNIDLSDIDFGNRVVNNAYQKANKIYNNNQKANKIENCHQKAFKIDNSGQYAKIIYNYWQVIITKYEDMSKDELIEEIKKLKGEK